MLVFQSDSMNAFAGFWLNYSISHSLSTGLPKHYSLHLLHQTDDFLIAVLNMPETFKAAYIRHSYNLSPGHTAFRVLTASESRPKNGTREADAVKREENAMKT